jgi:GDP-L-fucose synthase
MMHKNSKIYVAGHQGLVGSALMRLLAKHQYTNVIVQDPTVLDLRVQSSVDHFFEVHRPDYVFLAAARVGGIKANMMYPAAFMYDNLMINTLVIHAAHRYGVKKLLFLGSSCIYPRDCPQPIKEEYLLSGPLEPTNEPYAVAKIAGIKLCQSYNRQYGTRFITCMPTNIYGPCDTFDLDTAHVIPALLLRMYLAKKAGASEFVVWGTGMPYREFMYVDDLAEALLFLMMHYESSDIINIGTGQDISIASLATLMKQVVHFQGQLLFDPTKPDGTPRKLLSVARLQQLGWHAKTTLPEGLHMTFAWLQKHFAVMNTNKQETRVWNIK